MSTATMTMNRSLAERLGWTSIVDAGGTLLGSPPWGIPSARGQAPVPDWAGDWKACMTLALKYKIDVRPFETGVAAGGAYEFYCAHPTEDAAARFAVTKAAMLLVGLAQ